MDNDHGIWTVEKLIVTFIHHMRIMITCSLETLMHCILVFFSVLRSFLRINDKLQQDVIRDNLFKISAIISTNVMYMLCMYMYVLLCIYCIMLYFPLLHLTHSFEFFSWYPCF